MATIHDVASAAGVSTTTVSRVFGQPSQVTESTRLRVQAAASALGYRPNRVAALLRSGRTGTVGLLVPDLENPYFAMVTKGVQARARESGLTTFVVDSDEIAEREPKFLQLLADQTDGVLLCSPRALIEDAAAAQGHNVVLVNSTLEGMASVSVDYVVAMLKTAEHLYALGHRRVAYVGGPQTSWSDRMRRNGLAAAVNLKPDLEIIDLGSFVPRVTGGAAAADLAVASGATATIVFNDLMAIGLMNRLTERGLSIPGHMSVVGCDDTFVAQFAAVPLTTFHIDISGMGARAVDLLNQQLTSSGDGGLAPGLPWPGELVVRASTGVAPKHA
ncbi:MAG: LacI family transcriptional regulator [Propionibacteriaceae bacterium]|nr:LacI family transcriptional regulator [Propionibacteriaceae bacterium]